MMEPLQARSPASVCPLRWPPRTSWEEEGTRPAVISGDTGSRGQLLAAQEQKARWQGSHDFLS